MKITNKIEFLKLPKGTIYARYNYIGNNNAAGDDVDQILIKGETISNDWYYMSLIPDAGGNNEEEVETEWKKGELDPNYQIQSEYCEMRDGGFDDLDRFVIFNALEIRNMIKYLENMI